MPYDVVNLVNTNCIAKLRTMFLYSIVCKEMARRGSKYDIFTESEPVVRRGKLPPYEKKAYLNIQCPFCNAFFEIAKDADSKRQGCLKHLRESARCQAAFGQDVGEAPEKKRKVTYNSAKSDEELVTIYKLVF